MFRLGPVLLIFRSDFYHNMLMAGEVEQIVVYPAAKIALIFLRPDAIFKVKYGKYVTRYAHIFILFL